MKLPLASAEHGKWLPAVDAEIVDVAPHLADIATFAIHRGCKPLGGWTVSNVETGCAVIESDPDKDSCLERARWRLEYRSRAETIRALRQRHAEWGNT